MSSVLYIKSPNPAWMDIAADLNQRYGFEPRAWISSTDLYHGECQRRFPGSMIFNHMDAMRNMLDVGSIISERCVDADFLTKNAAYENIFYNMMDRWFADPDRLSIEKRRAYYIDMANNWFAFYEAQKIDLVIAPTVPHRLYDYVAYIIAQYIGIPFIMLDQSNELLIQEDDSREMVLFVIDSMHDRYKHIRDQTVTGRKPSAELQKYFENALGDYDAVQPRYFKNKDKKLSFKDIAFKIFRSIPVWLRMPVHVAAHLLRTRSFRTQKLILPYRYRSKDAVVQFQNIFSSILRHNNVIKRVVAAKNWYEAHTVSPDLTQKYIYFAPSFQPERSSTPDAGLCQWTEMMIETISNSIPSGWKIYFKEHPSNYRYPIRPDNTRSIGFYQRLKHIAPMLEFVPIDHDPLALIDHAQCVATSTGTSAWQAVTREVPAMVFGEIWFAGSSEVAKIRSIRECREFIERVQDGFKPSREKLMQYCCAVETVGGAWGWARGFKPYNPDKILYDTRKSGLTALCDQIYQVYATHLHKKTEKAYNYGSQ